MRRRSERATALMACVLPFSRRDRGRGADAKLSGEPLFLAAACTEGAQPVLRNEPEPESESGLSEHQPLRSEQHLRRGRSLPSRPAEDSGRDGRHQSLMRRARIGSHTL